jgi:hypothetical protein
MTVRPTLVPELICSDLDNSLAFYVGLLGFCVLYARPEAGSPISTAMVLSSCWSSRTATTAFGRQPHSSRPLAAG